MLVLLRIAGDLVGQEATYSPEWSPGDHRGHVDDFVFRPMDTSVPIMKLRIMSLKCGRKVD